MVGYPAPFRTGVFMKRGFADGHIESLAPADVTAHEKLYPQLTK